MLKKLQAVLFVHRPGVRKGASQFNGQLLDQNREDVYAVIHRQLSALR